MTFVDFDRNVGLSSAAANAPYRPVDLAVSSATTITSSGITYDTFTNPGAAGVLLHLDVTTATESAAASPTLDITVESLDPATGTYFSLPTAAFTQVTTSTSEQVLYIHPNSVNDSGTGYRRRPGVITSGWRVAYSAQTMSSGNTGTTYILSVGGSYIP